MMLDVRDLTVGFARRGDFTKVVHGIDFTLAKGETLGIVGESGSGKSMLALAIIGLLPKTARTGGAVVFNGENLLALPERQLTRIRGAEIGMIFQEPMTALNPSMTVGAQIAEALRLHQAISRAEAHARALQLMDMVRIARAEHRINAYPHALSGGERQRIGIAIALALRPALLIADEPTTALDVTVQAEILDILDDLVTEMDTSLILISHDLGVIARMADRVLVMHDGRVMEHGKTEDVLRHPQSAYTGRLIAALPRRVRQGLEAAP